MGTTLQHTVLPTRKHCPVRGSFIRLAMLTHILDVHLATGCCNLVCCVR